MTEKQRGMIRDYLPHGRDPELGDDEYYVEDLSGRIVKVITLAKEWERSTEL